MLAILQNRDGFEKTMQVGEEYPGGPPRMLRMAQLPKHDARAWSHDPAWTPVESLTFQTMEFRLYDVRNGVAFYREVR